MKKERKNHTEIRCGNCNRLLARSSMEAGEVELFCPRCKIITIVRATRPEQAPHDGLCGESHARTSVFPA